MKVSAFAFDSMGLAHFFPSAKLERLEIVQTHIQLRKKNRNKQKKTAQGPRIVFVGTAQAKDHSHQ